MFQPPLGYGPFEFSSLLPSIPAPYASWNPPQCDRALAVRGSSARLSPPPNPRSRQLLSVRSRGPARRPHAKLPSHLAGRPGCCSPDACAGAPQLAFRSKAFSGSSQRRVPVPIPTPRSRSRLSLQRTFPACGHWSSEHMVFRQESMRPLFPTMRTRWTTGRCGSPSVSFLLPRLVPEHRSPLSPFLAFLPSPDFAHLRLAHRPLACISIATAPCRSVNIPKRVVSPSRSWPPFSSGFDFMPPQSQLVVQRGSTSYAPLSFTDNYYAGRRRISPSLPFPQQLCGMLQYARD
ncbi:hypothetical protein BD309DRAFT_32142 [Dichomitus squalens]|uniref:Uncharacterized protein n=1 Tax=Dichomitus squalens TaxID=114155 RepID=A0A4Q9PKH2_9APHY|nr:hypothetical protein BD309DRAFT_32142 [Dichomitus squalens]TBU54647.1 hypothetical protein BD310DRAFT_64768 [Dichomitus squalens]